VKYQPTTNGSAPSAHHNIPVQLDKFTCNHCFYSATASSSGVALRSGHRYIPRTEVAERVRARLQDLLNEFDDIITESEEDNSDNDLVIQMRPSNEDDQPMDCSGDEQANENDEEVDANTNAYGMNMSPQSPSARAVPKRKATPRKARKTTTRRKRKTTRRKRYVVCFT
jgi:hypothetical protein